jgi:hypothetical protein
VEVAAIFGVEGLEEEEGLLSRQVVVVVGVVGGRSRIVLSFGRQRAEPFSSSVG